jgi:hypothetical protein
VSDQETGNPERASEILRRREERTSKLQRTMDRGTQRSQVEDLGEDTSVIPSGGTAGQGERGRPAKPIRITVDLSSSQHRFLREYCLDTATKGTAVLRGLLAELAEDPELRSRLMQRLKR